MEENKAPGFLGFGKPSQGSETETENMVAEETVEKSQNKKKPKRKRKPALEIAQDRIDNIKKSIEKKEEAIGKLEGEIGKLKDDLVDAEQKLTVAKIKTALDDKTVLERLGDALAGTVLSPDDLQALVKVKG